MTQQIDTKSLKPADTPEREALETDANTALELVEAIKIDSPDMYDLASDEIKDIVKKKKALTDRRLSITRPMDQAKKEVMALFAGPIATLEKAEKLLKTGMLAYDREQDRIADEKRRAAEAEAAKQREAMEAQAREAMDNGDTEGAAALEVASQLVTADLPAEPERKVSGISKTTRWSAEVTDKRAFIEAALKDEQYLDMITIDMKPLNQLAIALKDKMKVPGIKPVATQGMSVGG